MWAVLLQILAIIFGWLIVRQLAWTMRRGEILAASIVIGYIVTAWLYFVFAFIVGWPIAMPLTTVLIIFTSLLLFRQQPHYVILQKPYVKNDWRRWVLRVIVGLSSLVIAQLVLLSYQFPTEDGAWYSNANAWGDGPLHVAFIDQFAHGNTLDLTSPVYKKAPLAYPIMPDFWSGVLMRTTDSWAIGLTVPSLLVMLSLLQLLFSFANRLLVSARAALFSWLMIVFSGSLYAGIKMTEALIRGGIDGYHSFIGVSIPFSTGENYLNFIHSHPLPQRAYLFGMPLLIIVFTGVLEIYRHQSIKKEKRPKTYTMPILLGMLGGLLPLVHTHSFYVLLGLLMLMTVWLLVLKKKLPREWLVMLGCLAVVALPQLLWQFGTTFYPGFSHWIFGWMMTNFQQEHNDIWPWYWLRNIGWLFVMIVFGWFWLWRQRVASEVWLIYVAGVAIFFIANAYVFQPTYWDNMKFFEYALWFIMLASALVFARWSRNKVGLIATSMLMASLMFTGFYTLVLSGPQLTFELLSADDVRFGTSLREQINQSNFVLTTGRHNHPATMLGGAKSLVLFDGWYNLYGDKWTQTIQDRETMLRGGQGSKELIDQYKLTHAIFSEQETIRGFTNKAFFDAHYKLISYQYGWYVYDLQK